MNNDDPPRASKQKEFNYQSFTDNVMRKMNIEQDVNLSQSH